MSSDLFDLYVLLLCKGAKIVAIHRFENRAWCQPFYMQVAVREAGGDMRYFHLLTNEAYLDCGRPRYLSLVK